MEARRYRPAMPSVMTIIAAAPDPGLGSQVEAARAALAGLGADLEGTDWLAPDQACDLPMRGLDPEQAEAAVRATLPADAPIDIIAQRPVERRKSLLIADMDSTIVEEETLDELAAALGLKDKISAITQRAMNGELDFAEALKERVGLLAGLAETALAETAAAVTLMPGAKTLVATMKAQGARCILVSGGFTFFTGRVAAAVGFDDHAGNVLEIVDGKLTGRVVPPIRDKADKYNRLCSEASALGLPTEAVLAVGDGANDLPMLQAAGLGVAFRAKPSVRAAARYRIDHADLTALLFAQGYRREDFAA